ncbi:PaaI family thioesterase [Paenirhodobacter sp.]|uniref:PaaI family thioesterase n=1 Tax=Paenirhodobacter sp. TaxID=1965326 RepID=UPI003B3CD767
MPQTFAEGPQDFPPLATVLEMSGLEYMQKMMAGEVPTTTFARGANYRISKVEKGLVEITGTPLFEHTNAFGGVHGGWYGVMLDTCLTCAIITGLPKGQYQTTLEYKVNMVRAIPVGMEVTGVGRLEHLGRSTGIARGEIRGPDGRVYAFGTATCFLMTAPD